jgi:NAD(P)-dependent dehydrogenase (short-subunit alcohol dehydrogenase family)
VRALITGGAGGIGYETAAALVRAGWDVTLADRNVLAGERAAQRLRARFVPLDLADLAAVHDFARDFAGAPLDLLVNNAGILPPLKRAVTKQGHELALGIALLGHFALTAYLVPALERAPAPRVVGTTSLVQAWGRIDFDDLQAERRYEPQRAYDQSKLAALMFALELEVRAREAGLKFQALAAHPGIARTNIGLARQSETPRRLRDRLEMWAFTAAMRFAGQDAAHGALPLIHAATAVDAKGGEFYGPRGFAQWRGAPARVAPSRAAQDAQARARLWAAPEQHTRDPWLG